MTPVSHNQIGQKLGRKGQETRERIIAAMLRLAEGIDGPPITLTGVAREARVRPPNFYLYFPDMGELLLAVLGRVMDMAEDDYLSKLRQRWPDDSLYETCLIFVRAHFAFWNRHARLLHMRNALADAGDLRVLRYRNDVTVPLIEAFTRQFDRDPDGDGECHGPVATVLLTGLERLATVVTNPQFLISAGDSDGAGLGAYVHQLIEAEAEVISLMVARRRAIAQQGAQRQIAAG